MFQSIAQMPVVFLFLFVSLIAIAFSIIALFLVKKYIPLTYRDHENHVVGNISSLISIIYGVLVGLTALYLINNISDIDNVVQREANAVTNIYHDSQWLKDPAKSKIQGYLKEYLTIVTDVEWPLMKAGKDLKDDGERVIDKIFQELRDYGTAEGTDKLIVPDTIQDIKSLYENRAQRIHMSFSALTPEVWTVIIIGTILTIGINYFFGMNFYFHLLTVSAAALMASSMIFLLLTLDKPFQGEFVIESDSFETILNRIEENEKSSI